MKKKQLNVKLNLGKKSITSLSGQDTVTVNGGATEACARTQECSVLVACIQTINCPRTIQVNQTQCCPTWPPLCDSYLVSCLG